MPIYTFFTYRSSRYVVKAKNEDEAREKVENNPLDYSDDIFVDEPEFILEETEEE